MAETVFSKIIRKEIPAEIVYEDEEVIAFKDIRPQAPVHVLVVPKEPIETIADATEAQAELLGKLLVRTAEVARQLGIAESGYRLVINHGRDAGQEVLHLHIHLLGGRPFGWPPG
ncbi:MAG: histidine triad nucleotide-binding protein [Candidatus Poribacteria bacterium]|nr:MAG: histidine triad nucleotide-binding protein [Candidatus Poribacteria bacterium]